MKSNTIPILPSCDFCKQLLPSHYRISIPAIRTYKLIVHSRSYLVILTISLNCRSMSQNCIMSHNVRLRPRIPYQALVCYINAIWFRASSWWISTFIISFNSNHSRFIKCKPIFNPVSIHLETEFCIISKIFPVQNNQHL